jgi:hypothetical protein
LGSTIRSGEFCDAAAVLGAVCVNVAGRTASDPSGEFAGRLASLPALA